MALPLLSLFPRLRPALPHCDIGAFPTPVEPLVGIASRTGRSGVGGLFIKRDDLSATLYGGNKVRKLEFLLAAARRTGAKRIITSGAAGSNHALATALYARRHGFAVTLMLFEQPYLPAIGPTLLADFACGAELFHDDTYAQHCKRLQAATEHYLDVEGVAPYIIPGGGSSPLGAAGFVNAAFELREQIKKGSVPEPAAIYVAFGTMGTVAGLLIGLRAANIRSKIVAVSVVPGIVANEEKFAILVEDTCRLLYGADPSFPRVILKKSDYYINDDFLGEGYGLCTAEGVSAMDEFKSSDDIALDPVYTGKTAAAFLEDARSEGLREKTLLFWHTKSKKFPPLPQGEEADFHRLPSEFHRYFTVDQAKKFTC